MVVEDLVISEDFSVRDALKRLDATGRGILLVTHMEEIRAIITDFDIRRFMLSDGNLHKQVSTMANYNPIVLHIEEAVETKKIMLENKISVIPIIDSEGKVQRVEFLSGKTIYRKIKNDSQIVIMAGGKGARLQPLTNILPKPLIPIGNQTIIEHIIDRFALSGFADFNIIVNYKKAIIKAFFSKEAYDNKHGINIEIYEEHDYLGTGGGLKLLKDRLKSTFILTNCDILVNADYQRIITLHKMNNDYITVVCAPQKIGIPYGTIKYDSSGKITEMQEKPTYECLINTGLYVVDPKVINMIDDNEAIDFTDIIKKCLAGNHRVGIYKIAENGWQDMGEMSKLTQMDRQYGWLEEI